MSGGQARESNQAQRWRCPNCKVIKVQAALTGKTKMERDGNHDLLYETRQCPTCSNRLRTVEMTTDHYHSLLRTQNYHQKMKNILEELLQKADSLDADIDKLREGASALSISANWTRMQLKKIEEKIAGDQ